MRPQVINFLATQGALWAKASATRTAAKMYATAGAQISDCAMVNDLAKRNPTSKVANAPTVRRRADA
eukprot:10365859-Heterocapsa_arctica.AAC.1